VYRAISLTFNRCDRTPAGVPHIFEGLKLTSLSDLRAHWRPKRTRLSVLNVATCKFVVRAERRSQVCRQPPRRHRSHGWPEPEMLSELLDISIVATMASRLHNLFFIHYERFESAPQRRAVSAPPRAR